MTESPSAVVPSAARGIEPEPVVTFLFSDIEGSTRRWEAHPESMKRDLARHDEILTSAVEAAGGHVFGHTGDGMCAAFPTESSALAAAVTAQEALGSSTWAAPVPLRVRMAVHTGEAQRRAANYFGPTLNRTARLMSVGAGGQVLCSRATADRLGVDRPATIELVDLGEHRLADLARPERVYQVSSPGLLDDFPPLRSLGAHRHNLPVATNTFLGRSAELTELAALLEQTRLLSLVGVGGAGKTRLALQLAAGAVERYPAGVWLVGLAPVIDPALVGQTVADALGVDITGLGTAEAVATHLRRYLAAKRALLVFDNCEHLIDAAARLIHDLLASCPDLSVLATSQEVLGLPGEVAWRIPPLSLPGAGPAELAELERSDAVALFLDRAAAARPGFGLADGNAADIARICRRLDGIPLALELAAARVRSLGVRQVAERLDDCFWLLTGGSRTAASRHQTLRATLDWSFGLLAPEEQVALRRLGAFPASFGLDAAEAVVLADPGAEPPTQDADDAVELLIRLADKSLVVVSDDEENPRYRLLEPVRQYARERLAEAGEDQAASRRHRDHCLEVFDRGVFRMFPQERLERVTADLPSFRAALQWSWDRGEYEACLHLVTAMWLNWFFDGEPGGAAWLERILERTRLVETAVRTEALAGLSALSIGDPERQRTAFQESIELAHRIKDPHAVAMGDFISGELALSMGDLAGARAFLAQATAGFESVDDLWGVGFCEDQLGWVAVVDHDLDLARAHFERAIALGGGRAEMLLAQAYSALGPLYVLAGDPERGFRAAQASVELSMKLPIRLTPVMALARAGETAVLAGDLERATEFLIGALRRLADLGTERYLADCLELVALTHLARGRREAAGLMFTAAAGLGEVYGTPGARFVAAQSRAAREELAADPAVAAHVRREAGDTPIRGERAITLALAGLQGP